MPLAIHGAPRCGWLESLRGIAALQVFVLHLLGAFWLPALTGEAVPWLSRSPLALLYDGESAVFLFFVLSGLVLAGAFARQLEAPGAALAARLLRLGLPAAASCLLAFLVFHAFPLAHAEAGVRLGSSWLGANWAGGGSLGSLLWEAGPAALVLGFHAAAAPLPSLATAYNAPLWTLAIEFQGSVLVLALLLARRRWRAHWGWVAALALGLAWRTPYAGFLVGAIGALAPWPRWRGLGAMAGVAALAGGGLCWQALDGPAPMLAGLTDLPDWFPALSATDLQRSLGAMLGFAALAAAPPVQRRLEVPVLAWLGRLSFPLYLVHWPMIHGPGAAAFLVLEPVLGQDGARLGAMGVASLLSLGLALGFQPVDAAAVRLSRRLRQGLAGGAATWTVTAPPLPRI